MGTRYKIGDKVKYWGGKGKVTDIEVWPGTGLNPHYLVTGAKGGWFRASQLKKTK